MTVNEEYVINVTPSNYWFSLVIINRSCFETFHISITEKGDRRDHIIFPKYCIQFILGVKELYKLRVLYFEFVMKLSF